MRWTITTTTEPTLNKEVYYTNTPTKKGIHTLQPSPLALLIVLLLLSFPLARTSMSQTFTTIFFTHLISVSHDSEYAIPTQVFFCRDVKRVSFFSILQILCVPSQCVFIPIPFSLVAFCIVCFFSPSQFPQNEPHNEKELKPASGSWSVCNPPSKKNVELSIIDLCNRAQNIKVRKRKEASKERPKHTHKKKQTKTVN